MFRVGVEGRVREGGVRVGEGEGGGGERGLC